MTVISGRGEQPGDQVLPDKWGSSLQIAGHTHTFDKFLPAAEYFEKHPEWGALINGERRSWSQFKGQLCLSNQELLAAMNKKVLEQMDRYPHARMISVSMNDNTYRCECGPCLEIEKEEGALSGPLIRFVNGVAEEVRKKDPAMWVETLAYLYTIAPPKVTRPADNVIIRLTTYTDEHVGPFEENPQLVRKIEGWKAISQQLFIWDYQPDFHEPWKTRPNILGMGQNIRYMTQQGARGFFMESEERPTDFDDLRVWLAAQLLWNPEADETTLIKRFLKGYYGEAHSALYDYLKVLHEEIPRAWTTMTGFAPARLAYRGSTLAKAAKLMEQAKVAVADHPEHLNRVRREALAFTYLNLSNYAELPLSERSLLYANIEEAQEAVDAFRSEIDALEIPAKQPAGFGLNGHDAEMAASYLRVRLDAVPLAEKPTPPNRGEIIIPAVEFSLWGYGTSISLEKDDAAPTKVTAVLPTLSETWALQIDTVPAVIGKRWKISANVRSAGEGSSKIVIGVYRRTAYATLLQRSFTLRPSAGYQTLPVGELDLSHGDYIYATPASPFNTDGKVMFSHFILTPVSE